MARRSGGMRRRSGRQSPAGKLLGLGAAFVLLPLFLGGSAVGKAFSALIPAGLLLLAAGAVVLSLSRRKPDEPGRGPRVTDLASGNSSSEAPRPAAKLITEPLDLPLRDNTEANPTQSRPAVWGKAVFDAIEWRRFEAVVETLFRQAGFETRSQSHGADQGIDIWLYSTNAPGQAVGLVQCKSWSKRVGVDKVRELRGVMAAHDVKRGQFATSSSFTEEAVSFAKDNGIHLLDVNALLGLIAQRSPAQQQELLAVALQGDYWRPTCVNCGIKMVERRRKSDGAPFWACSKYSCKTTLPMRAKAGA
jgi:restriction system protein